MRDGHMKKKRDKKSIKGKQSVDPRFSTCVPTRWRDSLFVLLENHLKKNGLESPLIFALF